MSAQWTTAREYTDIKYETTDDGSIAKITINRPQVRNAFRPQTVHETLNALNAAHEDPKVGVVILTGEGPDAFCSGGDQKVRGNAGYIGEVVENTGCGEVAEADVAVEGDYVRHAALELVDGDLSQT